MPDDLTSVMHSATEGLRPDVGKLTAGGIERGVRKRRTRRVSQISGATLGVVAVFGVVAMVAPGHGGSGAGVSAATRVPTPGASSHAGVLTAPTSPAAAAGTTLAAPSKPATPTADGNDMVKWLEQALQPYHFSDVSVLDKSGPTAEGELFATLKIGYASGAGSVSLSVTRSSWQAQDGSLPPYFSVQNLPDGSHLEIFNGPEWPAGNGDPSAKRIDVAWYRTDGAKVDIMVLNEVQEKGSTTSSTLGLTVDQATAVAKSPVWDKACSALLGAPAPNGAGKPPFSAAGSPAR